MLFYHQVHLFCLEMEGKCHGNPLCTICSPPRPEKENNTYQNSMGHINQASQIKLRDDLNSNTRSFN